MQLLKIRIQIVTRGWFLFTHTYEREVLLPENKLPCGVHLKQHQSGSLIVSVHLYHVQQSDVRPLPVDMTLDAPFAQIKLRNVQSISVEPSQ